MRTLLLSLGLSLSLILPAGLGAQTTDAPAAEPAPAAPVSAPTEGAADKDIAEQAAELSAEVEDDKGFITRFLERNLSDSGRQVVLTGFQGALSSRATFTELSISDADGVWITLKNGAIQWDRTALFGRRIEINELSAEQILLPRLPGGGDGSKKSLEVKDFALPTLPVSVDIARISAGRVEIGEPVIGEAAVVSIDGSMNLANGEGTTKLSVNRVDDKRGVFAVDASFSNSTTNLKLDVTLDEDRDGLFANLIHLHDRPAVKAEIKGEGPLKDFAADIRLATDGVDRVTGKASARSEVAADGTPGTAFRLDLMGDVASLLPPDNRPFFGNNSKLMAEGWRGENGRMSIPALLIDTEALNLTGSVTTNEKGAPQSLVMLMTLGEDAGATSLPVRLPVGGADVRSGSLQISYDAAQSDTWTLLGRIGDLDKSGNHIGALTLSGNGTVTLQDGNLEKILGKLTFGAEGLSLKDKGIQEALGTEISGESGFDLTSNNALELSDFTLGGQDYGLYGTILADGLRSGITFSGELDAAYERLDRLSTLAGRPLTGQSTAHITGLYTALTGGFDAEAQINGTDITVDQEQMDRLLSGESSIFASVRRDDQGIDIRELTVNAQRLTAEASGLLSSTSSDLRAHLRLSSLTDADPSMSGALIGDVSLTGAQGARRVTVSGEATDLKLGIESIDAALAGRSNLTAIAQEKNSSFVVDTLRLSNPQLTADGKGSFATGALDATLDLTVPDIGSIAKGMAGSIKATATAREKDGVRFIDATGTGEDLRLGQKDVDGALTGTTDFRLSAEQAGEVVTVRDLQLTNEQMAATVQGVLGNGHTDMTAHAEVRSLAAFGRGWRGALTMDGTLKDDGTGTRVLAVDGSGRDISLGQAQADAALAGETRLSVRGTETGGVLTLTEAVIDNARLNAQASGTVGAGKTDLAATLRAESLAFLGNGFGGSVNASGRLQQTGAEMRVTADGTASGLRVGNEKADLLLGGQTRFDLAAARGANGAIALERLNAQNGQLRIAANGSPEAGLNVDGGLSDLALLVPGLPGPATLKGTVRQGATNFDVNLNATAPGGTRATIAGTAARNFSTADIRVSGVSDAALVNPMLRVRSVEGPVDFDLRLNGAPSLANITGQVNLPNATLSDPKLGLRVENLAGSATLNGGLIQVDATGNVAGGGRLNVTGPIDLRNGTNLDLRARLDGVVLRDPNLYETVVDGEVSVSGDPAQGPLITGTINLGPTEIRIPSTGASSADIPDIVHVKDRPAVRATRAKAGLLPFPSADSRIAGMNAPPATPPANPARLDLTIRAPNQIFVRGRGIDAELGGQLRLTGTARNMIPVGQFELIRGRVDLLGRRFDMTEGLIELQGSMVPVLRLVAESQADEITTRIVVDGDLRDPEIKFESSPDLPEEEVLSHMLFGRGLQNLSPLQAAQLANAVAVLAGRGSAGIISNLRDSVGLDDLDLATDDEGNVSVRAGKYLSRNLYTDVAVDADGKSKINLNLDVNNAITARGSLASDGESTLGVFYEKDY